MAILIALLVQCRHAVQLATMVTPPVALAAYAAAGSGDDLWNTGLVPFILAIPGFLIPYVFLFDQVILLPGSLMRAA